jgi:hypothetical protein
MDADRIRVARSRRRAPLLKSVGASERTSAGYVPPLERSGGTEGSNPVPSSSQSVSAANPEAESEKPRTLAAFLRVAWDVRRDVQASNRDSVALSL